MKFKHTPGAWEVVDFRENRLDSLGIKSIPREENKILTLVSTCIHTNLGNFETDHIVSEEDEANARLIAASPELLEALIDGLKENIDDGCQKCIYYPFRSEKCTTKKPICPKMKKILTIEKATGMKIDEAIKAYEEIQI